MTKDRPKTAVLLVAHGSRRQEANDDLVRLADLVRKRATFDHVETAYLELAEPSIPDGLEKCVATSPERVLIAPYFLSAGVHVVNDLEEFRSDFAARHPEIDFAVAGHLGVHPLMVDLVLERLGEAVG